MINEKGNAIPNQFIIIGIGYFWKDNLFQVPGNWAPESSKGSADVN